MTTKPHLDMFVCTLHVLFNADKPCVRGGSVLCNRDEKVAGIPFLRLQFNFSLNPIDCLIPGWSDADVFLQVEQVCSQHQQDIFKCTKLKQKTAIDETSFYSLCSLNLQINSIMKKFSILAEKHEIRKLSDLRIVSDRPLIQRQRSPGTARHLIQLNRTHIHPCLL